MVEGLLLHRIDAEPGRSAIGREHHLVVLARPDETQAVLAFLQLAIAWAHITLNSPVLQKLPVAAVNGVRNVLGVYDGSVTQAASLAPI